MSKIAATVLCYHYHILNTHTAKSRYIDAWLYCLDHAGLKNGIIGWRKSWVFVDEKTYAVAKSVSKVLPISSLCDNISGDLIYTGTAYSCLYSLKTCQLRF